MTKDEFTKMLFELKYRIQMELYPKLQNKYIF